MNALLTQLQAQFPDITYVAGEQFRWSPEARQVTYKRGAQGDKASWSLLHETGHALLEHTSYKADFELLRMEIAAWERARLLANDFGLEIDPNHIEDCLDTYRDWLHKRSICPTCTAKSLQQDNHVNYRCFNCHTVWKVSANRFGRSYRTTDHAATKKTPVFTEVFAHIQ